MAFITKIPPHEAEGKLKQIYLAREKAAGKVWQIVQLMSLNPDVLQSSMRLYQASVLAESPLARELREAIAVVVSKENACHY